MHREFLTPDYQPPVVLISVLLAFFVSYVTLDLAKRGRTSDTTLARAWWIGGSLAMGTGLWSMHFVGMVAREWPIPVGYDYGLLLLSWIFAVVACALPPGIASGEQLSTKNMVLGTATTATALCAMHYCGIHAMVMRPGIVWDWPWVAASIALALLTCAGVLRLFHWMHQDRGMIQTARQMLAATGLGAALSAILYCFMQAAHIPATAVCLSAQAVQATSLGVIGGIGAFLLLLLALLCSLLDARLQTRASALKHSLQEANQELKNAALNDNITHLPNRLVFEDRLDHAIQQADEQHCKIAVLFIDLDGFKAVNESFGHGTGDALLVEAAKRLNQLSRHTDTLVRVGADEFLMLLEGPMDTAAAAHVAQRVLASMGEAFHVAHQDIALSCSVGIAFYPDHGPRSKLVANADAAMSAAKRAGGGLHCFFEPNMAHDSAQEEIELQRDLRHAIERNELMLYYQPKISAKTNQVTGAEALLRWKHPKRGMVSPAVFIPIAERFGLIGSLGHWVLEEACRQVRDWLDQGLRVRVAINLSVHQLRQVDFVHRIREVFARYHIDPSLITFEITESVAMEDTQATMHAFERLANAGVILSIDDFGTGYSSLSYLRKLCARQLKIDRSFVQDLSQSQDAKAIVEAVIRLAHALGLSVVAEGVETTDQQLVLTDLGCDELQGFLFARPMPAANLTLWAMEDERPTASDAAGISFSNSIFADGEPEAPSPEFAPTQPLTPNKHW